MKPTREHVLRFLRACETKGDQETAHVKADNMLLRYIDDDEITATWEAIPKWFA